MWGGAVESGGGVASPVSRAVPIQSAMAHAPTLMREMSTTEVSPPRSRSKSAAAMPPAMIAPPIESPKAPAGWPCRRRLSGGVTPQAQPIRDQNVEPS